MDISSIIGGVGGIAGFLTAVFGIYKWRKELPAQEMLNQLEGARLSIEAQMEVVQTLQGENKRFKEWVQSLEDTLKKTKSDFEQRSSDMELRFSAMFEVFEMQLMSLNAQPIMSKCQLITADVHELDKLVDRMRATAKIMEVSEAEKNEGKNKWSKTLELFEKDFYNIKGDG